MQTKINIVNLLTKVIYEFDENRGYEQNLIERAQLFGKA